MSDLFAFLIDCDLLQSYLLFLTDNKSVEVNQPAFYVSLEIDTWKEKKEEMQMFLRREMRGFQKKLNFGCLSRSINF